MLNFKSPTFPFLLFYLFFVFCVLNVLTEDQAESSCSDLQRDEIEKHLSTKTPYRVVANLDEKPYDYKGCRPSRIWSVIRHGSRNPSEEIIEQTLSDLKKIQADILKQPHPSLCATELDSLRSWSFNISADEEKYLVAEGEDELVELAERLQKRFPNLLNTDYHPDSFYFKYTKTQRTLKSAQSFAIGLFGRHHINEIIYPKALHKDPVLRVS